MMLISFWINYSYKISLLINFGIFLEPHVEGTWHFLLICVVFFNWGLTCITTWIYFFTMFFLIKKAVPGLCFQIHRHLNVKYYSAKAGLWQFVIFVQKKFCLTAHKVRCIPIYLAYNFILYFRRSTIQPARNIIAKMISN